MRFEQENPIKKWPLSHIPRCDLLWLSQSFQILVIWRKKIQLFKPAEVFTELCHLNLILLLCSLGSTFRYPRGVRKGEIYRGNISGEGGNLCTHINMKGKLCSDPYLGPLQMDGNDVVHRGGRAVGMEWDAAEHHSISLSRTLLTRSPMRPSVMALVRENPC